MPSDENVLEKLVNALTAKNGGKDVEITHAGKKIVLPDDPAKMSLTDAMVWLGKAKQQETQRVGVRHSFNCMPLDGARALAMAVKEVFGFTELQTVHKWWGDVPPTMISVPIAPGGVSEQIPWGRMSFSGIEGHVDTQCGDDKPEFILTGEVAKRDLPVIDELVRSIQTILDERSIYRGRAVKLDFSFKREDRGFHPVNDAPQFLDVRLVDPSQLILPDEIANRVNASIFTPIMKREACRSRNIPGKRGVLLAGTYGVGKSLAALVTAHLSEAHQTTFLLVRDASDLSDAIEVARLYQPCVVFCEDIDRAISGERSVEMDEILNTIDGIESKTTDIMVVLTTNHLDQINPAMLRPGRIDDVIVIPPPDAKAAVALVKRYGGKLLNQTDDYTEAGRVLSGKIPAIIREIVERSKLAAVSRMDDPGAPVAGEVCAVDLVLAAKAMEAHERLITPTTKRKPTDVERAAGVIAWHLSQSLIRGGRALREQGMGELGDEMATNELEVAIP